MDQSVMYPLILRAITYIVGVTAPLWVTVLFDIHPGARCFAVKLSQHR
jgi:hypothetical protein